MLFNSISYLIFLPLAVCAYWCCPKQQIRIYILVIASYLFYASWLPEYVLLLGGLTLVNYLVGTRLTNSFLKKRILVLGICINLGTLAFYKYAQFFLNSVEQLCRFSKIIPSLHANPVHLDIILPLGISFFVFEFIHYLVDVYRGSAPIKSLVRFALFAAFFPSQIAGPIKRYQDFIKQLDEKQVFCADDALSGITLIVQGLFKKVALADNLSALIQSSFANATSLSTVDAWLAALGFAFQIYFDFSGYTDMGRGSAMLFGFSLPENFNLPYLATSLSEFWTRWHISLSTWLKDYLYIPLGGARRGKIRKYMNLVATMLLGGLWHGAAWHFVVWGALHGFGLVVYHAYSDFASRTPAITKFHTTPFGKTTSIIATFIFVLFGWVLFRAQDLGSAAAFIHSMLNWTNCISQLPAKFEESTFSTALCAYVLFFILKRFGLLNWLLGSTCHLNPAQKMTVRLAVCLTAFIASVGFAPSQSQPFLYFQF